MFCKEVAWRGQRPKPERWGEIGGTDMWNRLQRKLDPEVHEKLAPRRSLHSTAFLQNLAGTKKPKEVN